MKRTIPLVVGMTATIALLTGCGGAATNSSGGGDSDKLVVWNWGDSEASAKTYEKTVLDTFAEAHPDIEVEVVSQPFDNYYTLLGTAIQSNSGPDVVLFNGGTQIKSRFDALIPLDEYIPAEDTERLTGWQAFSDADHAYAVPTTMQGFPLYFNKKIYEAAGVDASTPPATWDELSAACTSIAATGTGETCFALGNKEQLGIEFFLSGFGPGIFTPEEYQAWLDGSRDWNSADVRQVFELWKKSYDDGWYNEGVNSTAMFNDEFDLFSGQKAGTVIGLSSGSANFTQFDEYLGDDLGVFLPPVVNPAVTSTYLPIEGGIGYGVTKWSKNPELAAELALTYADHDALTTFGDESGSISADTTVQSTTTVEAGLQIIDWLDDSQPLLHTALPAETLDLLHRLATQILTEDVTIDDAISQLAASDPKQ